ncbi:MAG: hypothetical protein IPM24_01635 [Bryobacterales bacterium]|nr:hypothetical protein [Bryobacterales bacterium]
MKRFSLALALCSGLSLHAAGTAVWEMHRYEDFVKGRFTGLSLLRDGRVQLAPQLTEIFSAGQPYIWSVARAADGTVYAGTGHAGKIYKIAPGGAAELLWTAPEPEVFALALDRAGILYAATSPEGKVYRVSAAQSADFFRPPEGRYLWALAVGPDGALYAATGDPGRIYRIAGGQGELFYDTGQTHVTSLAFDAKGRLLAGTEPNGLLFRIDAKDRGFVLYDANFAEIRALVPAPDGSVYLTAMGGAVARQQAAAQAGQPQPGAAGPAVTTSITVTAEAQTGPAIQTQPQPAQQQTPPTAVPQVFDMTGLDRSALLRIRPDHTVETLWESKEENAYDLALPGEGRVVFATDTNGRIYELGPSRKTTLLVETRETEALRLLSGGDGDLLAATGNLGKLFRIARDLAPTGSYQSPVHDAGAVARWGRIDWRAEGGALKVSTRSGNALRPDRTWSDWSPAMNAPGGIASPNARYIQWKAEFTGKAVLDGLTVSYLPQNSPPVLKDISVIPYAAAAPAPPPKTAVSPQSAATFSVTVTDTGDSASSTSGGTPTQTVARVSVPQLSINWQAEDPDGDKLVFTLESRGVGEKEWKKLKHGFSETHHSVDAHAFADGRYLFRVTASDREANAPDDAREDVLISAPILIDHTPPAVRLSPARVQGQTVEIGVEATDAASPLRRAEYSVNAGPWVPLRAADGVTDSQREEFAVRLEAVAGERVVVVRAFDAAENAGVAKIVLP